MTRSTSREDHFGNRINGLRGDGFHNDPAEGGR